MALHPICHNYCNFMANSLCEDLTLHTWHKSRSKSRAMELQKRIVSIASSKVKHL
ncbi:hypothetical protein SORBI_3005G029300 [Sorghum bicolor]|uniref:Uncharacterized protein n=1 Tax=Sorghum bicolor TaxID=4558 RepID=A0A1Z5RGX6_SORBI|nr:hypothetical protein SORBI_3005G029300 [Sorghum bicolor]